MPGGEQIGTICVIDREPGTLSSSHREFLARLSESIVSVLLLREQDAMHRHRMELAISAGELGFWDYDPLNDRLWASDEYAERFNPALKGRVVALRELQSMAAPATVHAFGKAVRRLIDGWDERLSIQHEIVDPRSGTSRWLHTNGKVVERDDEGRATRLTGTTKDITDIVRREHELQEAKEIAEQATRAKSDFLATMSHEIRNPINGVLGVARLLDAEALPAQQAKHVRTIQLCGQTLLSLVNDVLDFSKIEAGQMVLEDIEVSMQELLDEVGAVIQQRCSDKAIGYEVSVDSGVPAAIRGDPLRLRQILFNLLGNAAKFTSAGRVSLKVGAAGGQLVFRVTDTGPGISADVQQRLFERYAQAEAATARKYQGTGLGLAIVRDLCHLMGGDVTVSSEPGAGAVFTVSLPLRVWSSPKSTSQPAPPSGNRTALRVLLVDDNEVNLMVGEGLLNQLGVDDVQTADCGEAALSLCAQTHFDLVLMDVQMPGICGLETTRRLRHSGFAGPIVALSGGAIADERDRCMGAGMNDYLGKPVDPRAIAACLHSLKLATPRLAQERERSLQSTTFR